VQIVYPVDSEKGDGVDWTAAAFGAGAGGGQAAFYRHSGKVSFFGVAVGLVIAAAMVIGLAPLYALVLVYNPSAYLGVVMPFLFSAGIGWGLAFAMKKLGTRNAWVAPVLALGTAGAAYLVSWPLWVAVWLWRGDGDPLLAFWPPSFVQLMASIYAEGVWTIGRSGSPVSGFLLGAVWAIEAIVVVVTAPLIALSVSGNGVYCERCQGWCTRADRTLRLDPAGESIVVERLNRRDLAALSETPRVPDAQNTWTEASLDACEGCGGTNALLVEHVDRSYDNRGNAQLVRTTRVPHLLVSKEESDWIKRVFSG
jgi:hypothetical protein